MTTGTRIHVRHAGDHSPEWLAERGRKAAERRAELEERMAAFAETNPEMAKDMERRMNRRGR